MSNISLTQGILIPNQSPLDTKGIAVSENALKNLGTNNNLAYTYYNGLTVICRTEGTTWVWREVVGVETGLLPTHFLYTDGTIGADGIDYSLKFYNFFKPYELTKKVDKEEGKSLIADTKIAKVDNIDNTKDIDKVVSTPQEVRIQSVVNAQITNSTALSNPNIPIVALGNVHILGVGEGTYSNWGGMVVPANNFGTLQRVDGVYSVSLTAINLSGKVNVTDVINTLTSTETNKPGSANNDRLLDEKITPIKNQFDELLFKKPTNRLTAISVTNGFYLNGDGVPSALVSASYTDFIDVSAFDKVWFSNNLSGSFSLGGGKYNSSHTFLGYITLVDGEAGFQEINTVGISYVKLNIQNYSTADAVLSSDTDYVNITKRYLEALSFTDAQFAEIFSKQGFTVIPFVPPNKLDSISVTTGFYLNGDGVPAALAAASYTDFIDVSAFDKVWFSNNLSGSFNLGGCFYNSSYTFINYISLIEEENSFQEINTIGVAYIKLNIRDYAITNAILYSDSDYVNQGKIVIDNLLITINTETVNSVISINSRNINSFIGATNTVIDALIAAKPKARFVFLTHFTEDGIVGNRSLENLIKAQIALAEYWGTDILVLSKKLNWVKKNGKNTLASNVPDELHPGTDTTLESVHKIKRYVKQFLTPMFDSWAGKKIAWYGTSIPYGHPINDLPARYPDLAVNELGGTCLNKSYPGFCIRRYKFDGSALGAGSFLDNTALRNYQQDMVDLIGTANEPDLFVFDFGINDWTIDKTDFEFDENIT